MDYPKSYLSFLECGNKIFSDSRKPIYGGVFVALSGPNFDGNAYALDALNQGAAYAIVDRDIGSDSRLIKVENSLMELQHIANLHRNRFKTKIIAITGTNGKTTTKELCYSIFKQQFKTLATEGNLNNHIGVPLTLLRLTEETEFLILEMGANHIGDISELCQIAKPECGLITNIGKAHLEGFGSFEGVIKAKLELFDYLKQSGGIRFCSMFSDILKQYANLEIDTIRFGPKSFNVHFASELIRSFPDILMKFFDSIEHFEVTSQLFGAYNYENIAAACSLASHFQIPKSTIQKGVGDYIPSNMRSQIIKRDSNTILLDAYNANPSSMKNALVAFDHMDFKNKWVILGEMAELGQYAVEEHQEILSQISNMSLQKCILIGAQYISIPVRENFIHFDVLDDCKNWIAENWPEHTAILLKGSRAAGLERLLN